MDKTDRDSERSGGFERSMTRKLTHLAAVTALLVLPAGAHAATITNDAASITYVAAPGETNNLVLSLTGDTIRFRDDQPITVSGDCTAVGNTASCTSAKGGIVTISLGDKADSLTFALPKTAGNPPAVAASGGAGVDSISFIQDQQHSVFATLDNVANDGSGTSDNIADDFEVVEGTRSGDIIGGSVHDDTLIGAQGEDAFLGGPGDDLIDARDRGTALDGSTGAKADSVDCGAGTDIVDSDAQDDVSANCELVALENTLELTNKADKLTAWRAGLTIDGLKGADTLVGSAGRDSLIGGKGKDKLNGRAGNDHIFARDGERDTIRCGAGKDIVQADKSDSIARDCEKVARR